MLSAAKVKIHGMQDERWVIKDKISQYRGLISLYERDRKIHDGDLVKQKKRYSRDIRHIRKEIVEKRLQLGTAVYGDKQFLRNALQDHRRLQLAYMNSQADKVLECVHQDNFNKRKQLDRIQYTKKRRMERFQNLKSPEQLLEYIKRSIQLESAELKDRIMYEVKLKLPAEKHEQTVANYVQCANIKKNAALAIKTMYNKILDILKKDSSYFTVVLEALKVDCRAQGKCLMGATEMGQLAMEYLDDRKFEFSRLEKEIKVNMKERERTLRLVRREVQHLTDSFPILISKDETENLDDLYEDMDTDSVHSVHWELDDVLATCKNLQRETLVSTFDRILPRLKEQRYQSERLSLQLRLNSMRRDAVLEDRCHSLLMLDTLKNVGQEETCKFISEKRLIREQLSAECKEQERLAGALHEKGNLVMDMRLALQHLLHLLANVGASDTQQSARRGKVPPTAVQYALDEMIQPVPEVEADFDKLLAAARQKLVLLVAAVARIDVTPALKYSARNFYQDILMRSMRDSYSDEITAEGALIEFEAEDPGVPSHAVVKLRSKQLVDAQVSEFDVPD